MNITDFDNFLKADKGWKRNISGYEYIYDYKMAKAPHITIKVMTTMQVENSPRKNYNSDNIRVFAIQEKNGKYSGFHKAIQVKKDKNWQKNVVDAFMKIREMALNSARH